MTVTYEERSAIEWLESLSEIEHAELFAPAMGADVHDLATVKFDHEAGHHCSTCQRAGRDGLLVVIE